MQTAVASRFFDAVVRQDAGAMRDFFTEDAEIYWHNSNEAFTVNEYIRANCEYPGTWRGEIERIECAAVLIVAARVWSDDSSSRVVSFLELSGGRIRRLDEYWGDVGEPPAWRRNMGIGRKIY